MSDILESYYSERVIDFRMTFAGRSILKKPIVILFISSLRSMSAESVSIIDCMSFAQDTLGISHTRHIATAWAHLCYRTFC